VDEPKTVEAEDFKATCLEMLDQLIDRKLSSITITKHGRAIAKLVPVEVQKVPSLFGAMKGTVPGVDLTEPIDVEWEAMKD